MADPGTRRPRSSAVVVACAALAAASLPWRATAQATANNYTGNTALAGSIGTRLASMGSDLGDAQWTAAESTYASAPAPSLRSLGQAPVTPPAAPSRERQMAAAYWGSSTFADDFVTAAITANATFWGVDLASHDDGNKTRDELAMKGVALQTCILAVLDNLHAAWVSCLQGDAATAQARVTDAWAYFAASKGPIALGEKRCPQFGTCTSTNITVNGMNVRSAVNKAIVAQFALADGYAQAGTCNALGGARDAIRSQVYVPVIQGMMREAYETDPNGGAGDADGFVEVAEGWAFAAAVLPLIAECNAANASTIRTNMDTLGSPAAQRMPVDGYLAVVRAAEAVYPCLGVVCGDVKAMVDSGTGAALWSSCTTAAVGSGGGGDDDDDVDEGWRSAMIVFIVAVVVGALGFAIYTRRKRRPQPGKATTLVNKPFESIADDAI